MALMGSYMLRGMLGRHHNKETSAEGCQRCSSLKGAFGGGMTLVSIRSNDGKAEQSFQRAAPRTQGAL
jgi:hypothetical protein